MVFSIVIVVLIVAAVFFQTIHGLFSSFIMMMLTLLSAALAMGMYENLYYGMVRDYTSEYGEAIALVGLFAVFLLLLRVLFDQMIGGNMVLPPMVDRIGGAACGIVTALVAIGMLAIGFQLLPFDATILGFKRMDGTERKHIALNPDGFTVRLVSHLSSNALSGRQSLASFHPDYLLGIHACRSVQKESVRHAPIEALWEPVTWKLRGVVEQRTKGGLDPRLGNKKGSGFKKLKPTGGKEWRVFRVQVKQGQDSDGRHRFTRYSWRLVGVKENGEPAEFYATAYKRGGDSAESGKYIAFDPDEFVAPQVGKQKYFDIVFGVPPTFTPRFLEYKRTARIEITKRMLDRDEPPHDVKRRGKKPSQSPSGKKKKTTRKPPGKKPPAQSADGSKKSGGSGGGADKKIGRVDAGKGGTDTRHPFRAEQTNAIPIFLSRSAYSGQNATTAGTELGSGHVTVGLPAKDKIKIGTVQTFRVPKGVEMWQVSSDPSRGRSLFGKALSFAKGVTAQYRVTDGKGKTYFAIGEVRIARKDKGGRVEIIYRPEMADSTPDQALRGDRRISEQQLLTDGSQVVFLFLLPPGEKVTSFKASKREYPIVY